MVYAVSDIHGHFDIFLKGLKEINFGDNDFLYVVGDAIDRGLDGIRLLNYIRNHKNMDLILGNHELLMMDALASKDTVYWREDFELWTDLNGGYTTYKAFMRLSKTKQRSLLWWLKERPLIITKDLNGEKFCFTHSCYNKKCENLKYYQCDHADVWNIVWRSIYRTGSTMSTDVYSDTPYTFITGHVPVMRARQKMMIFDDNICAFVNGNLINIDGGCAYGGGAIFLRLDDMKQFVVTRENVDISDVVPTFEDTKTLYKKKSWLEEVWETY